MKRELKKLQKEFDAAIKKIVDFDALIALEQEYFGRKNGQFTNLVKGMKDLTGKRKKEIGQLANEIKLSMMQMLTQATHHFQLEKMQTQIDAERIDVTQPYLGHTVKGHLHPLTEQQRVLEDVARAMGFRVEDGPELESDYFVFESLNFPADHPARESMDTFYIKDHPHLCMRAHVSNMQARVMRKYGAPLRVAYPGRVFRNEATDASHEHTFYQFEALVVDENVSIAHLIAVIKELLSGLFKKDIQVRLRPGYFPFVEPGFEMDMSCLLCEGNGCAVCKQSGWVEMLGCGLVHPNVIKAGGLDPEKWQGLAFGMGLNRLVMMKYGIEDIRHFMSGNLKFLEQF